MKKRLVSLLLVLALAFTLVPSAFADSSDCGIPYCTCTGYCTYGCTNYRTEDASTHLYSVYCTGCGLTAGIVLSEEHTFRNGECIYCGYSNGSGGWEPDYCYHDRTRTTWDGCYWYEYCRDCGELVDYGRQPRRDALRGLGVLQPQPAPPLRLLHRLRRGRVRVRPAFTPASSTSSTPPASTAWWTIAPPAAAAWAAPLTRATASAMAAGRTTTAPSTAARRPAATAATPHTTTRITVSLRLVAVHRDSQHRRTKSCSLRIFHLRVRRPRRRERRRTLRQLLKGADRLRRRHPRRLRRRAR